MRIKIAARHSDLARLQAYRVGDALKSADPQLDIEYSFRASLGDKNLTDPLWKMPEKGVFTEDFLKDLKDGFADIVVHSWKDLPTEERPETMIAGTLERADVRDLFLLRKDRLEKVKNERKLKVYSSSPRRAYNLEPFFKSYLPVDISEVQFIPVRGNVPTRFKKFFSEDIDGLVIAKAALDRLLASAETEFEALRNSLRSWLSQCKWMVLPIQLNPSAAAQGALAIEIRKDREDLYGYIERINNKIDFEVVHKEREILRSFGGGCHQKIGVTILSRHYGEILSLRGLTDQGEVLNQWCLTAPPSEKFNEEDIWPLNPKESQFFERKRLKPPADATAGRALWIAREDALPTEWRLDDHLVWTSGVETWKKLAARGVWVNGSAEGLGEDEDPRLDWILSSQSQWIKLSHNRSGDTKIPLASTYELVPKTQYPDLSNKKCFFWMSGSSFERAIDLFPEIRKAQHWCGPGNTYQFIKKVIGNVNISLGYQDWLKKVKKES